MKKRKFSIFLNIAVLCLCLAAIAFGVYSAKNAQLNMSGTIGFTAHNCKVRVKGDITNAVIDENSNTTLRDSADATKGVLIGSDSSTGAWNIGAINFDDLNVEGNKQVNDITFTFEVTNESDYWVDCEVNTEYMTGTRINIYSPNQGAPIAPNGTITLKVYLQLDKDENHQLSNISNLSLTGNMLNFYKSAAPAFLSNNWKTTLATAFSLTPQEVDIFSYSDGKLTQSKTYASNTVKDIYFINDTFQPGISYNWLISQGFNEGPNLGEAQGVDEFNNTISTPSKIFSFVNSSGDLIIYSPGRIYAPEDCTGMFAGFSSATQIILQNFDTNKTTKMTSMFLGSTNAVNISSDYSGLILNLDTTNVIDMSCMFLNCTSLKSLDLSNFNTQNTNSAVFMFQTIWGSMATDNLEELNLRNFHIKEGNGVDISAMLGLETEYKLPNGYNSFSNMIKLQHIDLTNFNTTGWTDMSGMFNDCQSLISLDLSSFDTSSVVKFTDGDSYGMFSNCKKLEYLDISSFDTSNATEFGKSGNFGVFEGCSSLKKLDLSNFNTDKVTDMSAMFRDCTSLIEIDLSGFNMDNLTHVKDMFNGCTKLTKIYTKGNLDLTTNASLAESYTNENMFKDCSVLVGGAGTVYDLNKVDKSYARVDRGTTAPGYFTAK